MKDILVIKLGGILLNSNVAINNFFRILHYYKKPENNILIVHGGEFWAKKIFYNLLPLGAKHFLYNKDYHDNLDNDFKISIFSGIIRTNIVKHANINGVHAIGLHCTDGDTIVFNSTDIQDGIYSSNNSLELINHFFSRDIIPIISPTGITKDNFLIHFDADLIAMLLTKALKARLIFLTDVSGVLDGKGKVIKEINFYLYKKLILDGIISGGMLTKVNTAMEIAKYFNQPVNISGWTDHIQLEEIFSNDVFGTTIMHSNKEI